MYFGDTSKPFDGMDAPEGRLGSQFRGEIDAVEDGRGAQLEEGLELRRLRFRRRAMARLRQLWKDAVIEPFVVRRLRLASLRRRAFPQRP